MGNRQTWLEQALFVSWAISVVATLGSLYFSEVLMFIPCELCWYQRILMYPLTIHLGIAVVRKDYNQSLYTGVLAVIGAAVSTYHYLIQKMTTLSELGASCGVIPCTTQYINWLGFVTIPFLALVAFLSIALLQYYIWQKRKG
ncbi:disulfide bond formation protein B [Brevibacillus humidisoli]|uniref:disulfide oxidoreductase n=1 Tax=Brevibacillus humidisoli TaxID=2895522 RepID=UPI001E4FC64C|nr:disulfide oxidoreductase [Brevibacillus humidisoli]UFJ39252.1 disulfide bond formation protein B [Brevibacillus humidisoli]